MSVHVLYAAKATATGGRDGRAVTADGSLDVTLTTPKELGGSGGPGNNPEQLFAACYAACFLGAMRFVASQGGPKVPDDARVTATVGIGPRSQGGFGLDVQLDIALPGMAQTGCRCAGAASAFRLPVFQRRPQQRSRAAGHRLSTKAPRIAPAGKPSLTSAGTTGLAPDREDV